MNYFIYFTLSLEVNKAVQEALALEELIGKTMGIRSIQTTWAGDQSQHSRQPKEPIKT